MPEAFCPAKGEIKIEFKDWKMKEWEREWVFTSTDEVTRKAMCQRPFACGLR